MKGQTSRIEARSEVILCAGAINSPKILLLSGVGPAAELKRAGVRAIHDLPGVGKNLQDHLDVYCCASLREPVAYNGHDKGPMAAWHTLQFL
ncbi:GMC family oxidoreductase N-terminal domain-containing protein, partial [Mesorhizobium sp. M1D.F.Ca.ET.234.01.1.1]|uniref:GMC family oxidoreductase N-terminal domain-containing protein n=1 Tax=Mesorhizobium sp. M1D.F.Ca.ET.234.01.1.1 TaxID=2563932 RepID=UPI001FDF7692